MLIIDTHQHLWNTEKFRLAWLAGAPEVLRKSYGPPEYRLATQGLNVKSVYMEVDVDPAQHIAEADYVSGLAQSGIEQTIAAVVGGRPASPDFVDYVKRLKRSPYIRGVRQVLHVPETPAGTCLNADFVRGVQFLGEHHLSFDLCMRPRELGDAIKLVERCPRTVFILDHCGNADPKAFMKQPPKEPWHDVDGWKRDITALGKHSNVVGKISGIVARAPQGWKTEHLAPIVNHCLDSFGPDRVVFGGDWPVCLLGAPLARWIEALGEIISTRPAADQRKLWSENAVRIYQLKV